MVNVPMKSRKQVMVFGSLIIALTVAMGVAGLTVVRLAHAASFAVTDCTQEGTATTAGTISKAIDDATADAGTSESITFTCGTGNQMIPMTTPLVVNMSSKTLTIDGTNGSGTITLDGGSVTPHSKLMIINSATLVTLESLSFTNASATNSSRPLGGAISDTGSDLTLSNDTFAYDEDIFPAEFAYGGALYMNGGNLLVQNSTFDHDTADQADGAYGGAIYYTSGGTLSISGSTFTNDSVQAPLDVSGGAIEIKSSSGGSITDSTFDYDSATSSTTSDAHGGAVESMGTLDTVSGDTFTYDSVSGPGNNAGGAFENLGSLTSLSGCTFDHNSAITSGASGTVGGGALDLYGGFGTITTLTTSSFTNNSVTGVSALGGALFISGTVSTISGSAFVGNSATTGNLVTSSPSGASGGAIAAVIGHPLTIANSTFSANVASASGLYVANGGAIAYGANGSGSLALVNDSLSGDSATGISSTGGEVSGDPFSASLTITNTIVANGTITGEANNCSGDVINGGNNIDSGTSCGFGSASHSMSNTDPKLGTPTSFSGSTLTYPLRPESPAIDAGNDAACAAAPVSGTDQRGTTRPEGAHCDIGAYEFVPITTGTTLTASPSTQAQGQPVQLCATVTGTSGTPAGSVTFSDGSTTLGTATLSGGTGCYSTSSLALGTHSNLTAKYTGDPSFLASTSSPASVFIGVVGNGGAASGAQPVNPQGPSGGPVTSTGSSNTSAGSSGTANSKSTTKTTNTTSQQGGLPGWLLVVLVLIVLAGGAGGAFYLRQRGLLAR